MQMLRLAVLISVLVPRLVFAEFTSDQVAVLANANSNKSLSVARHYAELRGIPASHILILDVSTRESISRQSYEQDIIRSVRGLLKKNGLAQKIRILVTTYGLPLRVQAPRATRQETQWLEDAKHWQKSSLAFLRELEQELIVISSLEADKHHNSTRISSGEAENELTSQDIEVEIQRIARTINQSQSKIQRLVNEKRKKLSEQSLRKVVLRLGGLAEKNGSSLGHSDSPGSISNSDTAPFSPNGILAIQRLLEFLNSAPSNTNRERAYKLVQEYFGIVGVIRLATQEIESFQYQDADASVDNELSLLWWDREDYRVSGRIPNPLYAWYRSGQDHQVGHLPILLVSRIDAPTPMLAMQMVDQAMKTEQMGLTGRVYIDARGLKPGRPLGYGYYDQSLRDFAQKARSITSYEVVLDNTKRRFSQPGDAPEVGLYVGWYKLRSYEDAFTFNPGAIGYHIASGEAVSIHDPSEQGWCKNALERGIAVTLGPIGEPYLDAFPLPTEFFGLMLSGRYSLVEAYYLSIRYLSWRMVLFGDPLYNPWRDRALESKVQASGILRTETLPASLVEIEYPDPVKVRKQLRERQQPLLSTLP